MGESHGGATTIDTLADDVLLEIFDFYRKNHINPLLPRPIWEWHLLVHVCRRWRHIIFESPRRLDLQILCTYKTFRKDLGIWPAFPLAIHLYSLEPLTLNDEDNAVAALKHPDRVYTVRLSVTRSQLGKMAAVMQEPFPVLKYLEIYSKDGYAPDLPAEFLGGSAPCAHKITLCGIPYPALPTLLLSTSGLVALDLRSIPQTGYISPEIMVTSLAALPSLESLTINFLWLTSRPDRDLPPLVTRTVIPSLTSFYFEGVCEYLEDLVARIDSPKLNRLISYLDHDVGPHVTQLSKFIDRSGCSKLSSFRRAEVTFYLDWVAFDLHCQRSFGTATCATIQFETPGWDLFEMARALRQFSSTFSTVFHLELELEETYKVDQADDVEWLSLLRQFSALKVLYVSRELARPVALELETITAEMVAEVLPFLDLVYLEDQPPSSVEKFVASRRYTDHPVTVVSSETEFDQRIESHRR